MNPLDRPTVGQPIDTGCYIVLGPRCEPMSYRYDTEEEAIEAAEAYAQRLPDHTYIVVRTVCARRSGGMLKTSLLGVKVSR